MPWAEPRKHTWRAGWRDANGDKQYQPGFTTERAAKNYAAVQDDKVKRGRRHDPAGARMRWGDWAETWWLTRSVEESTNRAARVKLDNHVIPRWGNVKLGQITRLDVQTWVLDLTRSPQGKRDKPLSPSSARQCFYLLSSSLRAAVAHGLIELSPCVEIKLPTLPIGDEKFLTDDEVARLFEQLDEAARLYAELLLATGLRVSEASGLHLHRVHLEDPGDPWIEVVETYEHVTRTMRPHPKSKTAREVPLTFELVEWLDKWWTKHPPDRTCRAPHEAGAPPCRSGLVLTGKQGGPIDPHNFVNRQWKNAVERSGVIARPHDLRHSYASRLLTAGVEMARVQQLLGHSSIQTTERYSKLMNKGRGAVRSALGSRRVGAETGAANPVSIGRRRV